MSYQMDKIVEHIFEKEFCYLAMPGIEKDTEQRGGTVITLHQDSSYDISQVKLTDIE